MRGVMDAVTDHRVKVVVVMSSAQVGKTETLLNILGFHMTHDPAPILMLQPTLEMGEAFSKDRLAPMLRDTPALQGKVKDPRARDSGNTLLHKVFLGGHITIAGSNSPASLASRPIRVVLADEVDRYPPSAGTEGDPLNLAQRRTATFWNRKTVVTSTPTVKGFSRVETEFLTSDQRRFFVPCPDCGADQVLQWKQVQWPEGQPARAAYVCEHCGSVWSDASRYGAIRYGEWRATAPFNGVAGFHLNEIYSAWTKLGDLAERFMKAKEHPETLKTWINTSLGETWEEDAERVDPNTLQGRAEAWAVLPPAIMVLTAGVDLQGDRIEIEVVGWGVGEESWSVDHRIIYGDPSAPEIWKELTEYLESRFEVDGKGELVITAACIDTGGHHTQAAYAFCRDKFRRRFYAIKGIGGPGRPVWPKRASKNNTGRINLFMVGVDAAKDMIYSRLKVKLPGPGYCHFPKGRDGEYFRQMTAERVTTKYVKGFPTRVYIKDSNIRNEALDLRVYAYAALVALNVNWGRLQRYFEPKPQPPAQFKAAEAEEPDQPPTPPAAPPPPFRKRRRVVRSSYMNR